MPLKSTNKLAVFLAGPIIIFLFAGVMSYAQKIDSNAKSFYVYIDSTSNRTIDQVVQPSFQKAFKRLKSNEINYDIVNFTVWIKFILSDSISNQRYLEITCPNIHRVEYFMPHTNDQFREFNAGFLEDFEKRPIQIDRMTFPIARGQQPHYIKLKSEHFLNTRFEIRNIDEVTQGAAVRELILSLYDGLMIAIIAGVLFYIFLIRYYSYFYYIGYIIFISSINLTEKGFYFQFLWPHLPTINYYFPLLPFGVSFCMLLFLRSVWNNSISVKVLYRINFWVVTVLPFGYVVYYLLQNRYSISILITQAHSFMVCLIVIITSIVSYINSTHEHRRFFKLIIMGLCIFSLGVITYLLSQNHIFQLNSFTENAIVIGSTVEVCFFTMALILHSDTIYKKQKNKFLERNPS
jgi:hypothetical protein